jgi:HlyD family secretion protein
MTSNGRNPGHRSGHRPGADGARAGAVLPFAILALAVTACATTTGASEGNPAPASPGRGEVVLRRGPVEDTFLLTGELKATRAFELTTPRSESWRVQVKWLREDGTEVEEGDPLVEFDNAGVLATIEEKRRANIQTEVDLETRKVVLDADRHDRELALDRALHEAETAKIHASIPEELSNRKDWLASQSALSRAEAEVDKARKALETFEVSSRADLDVLRLSHEKAAREIEEGQRVLDSLTLKAPRRGIFMVGDNRQENRKFQVGDTAWPGLVIGSIPDLSGMEVSAWLADVDDGRVEAGSKARCILDTYPSRVFNGTVEEVSSLASDSGFRVRISLDSPDPAVMRPGMSVRAEVVRANWQSALAIPREAIRWNAGKAFVEVIGREKPVEVEIAACTPMSCIAKSGVSEGDHVLVR